MSCPDHDDCDGNPLTCMVREGEALGLYDFEPDLAGDDDVSDMERRYEKELDR